MTGMDYFPLIFSGEEQVFLLDDHQIAVLLRALFTYSRAYSQGENLEIEIDDPMVRIVFVGLFGAVRERFDEYRRKCEINSMNARGHGAPKGNQNARKVTEEGMERARNDLRNGNLHAAKTIVDSIVQRTNFSSEDGY